MTDWEFKTLVANKPRQALLKQASAFIASGLDAVDAVESAIEAIGALGLRYEREISTYYHHLNNRQLKRLLSDVAKAGLASA